MAIATWTDLEKRKLEERLRVLEAQIRRTAREADARSMGTTFNIPEDNVQVDGDMRIEGDITFDDVGSIQQATPSGRLTLNMTAGESGDVGLTPGIITLQSIGAVGTYYTEVQLDSYSSPALVMLYTTDGDGTNYLKLFPTGLQLNGAGATVDEFSTDGTLGDNSDTALPTEKAVKTYADAVTPDPQNWTPTVTQSGGVDVTVNYATYTLVGKKCHVEVKLTVTGSGSSGNAIVIGGQPAAMQPARTGAVVPLGLAIVQDSGVANYTAIITANTATGWQMYDTNSSGARMGNGFGLASGDTIFLSADYLVA